MLRTLDTRFFEVDLVRVIVVIVFLLVLLVLRINIAAFRTQEILDSFGEDLVSNDDTDLGKRMTISTDISAADS